MEVLKEFVVTLVTTIIFMTAIELIGPDNDMKKYLKFVLGLILVAVILNPIVNFLTKGEGYLTKAVESYTNEIISESKANTEENNSNEEIKKKNFKENFDKNCESTLNEKFGDFTFESDADSDVNFNDMSVKVNSLRIYAKPKGIRKIEKVTIGKDSQEDDEIKKQVKSFLSNELNIDIDKIQVNYK